KNAIVKTLHSVETLGSATVICSDKTGTLTQNKMTVVKLNTDLVNYDVAEASSHSGKALQLVIENCALCNDARFVQDDGAFNAIGDPTEIALIEVARTLGALKDDYEAQMPRIAELPFDSERKLMSTVHDRDGEMVVFVKGAMDILLERCNSVYVDNAVVPITEEHKQKLQQENLAMAQDALRVLGMGYKVIDQLPDKDDLFTLEQDLTFIGMTGMIDPPREEAKEAVLKCKTAGITAVMITGDHLATAIAIAKSIGILEEGETAITGAELELMSDEQLREEVANIAVYARISPEHKVRIVNAWRDNGHVVAMTGDGVNDAPALKNADIGAAMGIVGTEVAKEAADMILTDDNFATVVTAVEEGRRIYDNILKAIQFLLSCNVGEIITLFVATMLNWHEPLLPIHILWVNLVTDSLPALGLGVDPAEKGIMERQAVKSESVFSRGLIWRMLYQGVYVGAITLVGFMIGSQYSLEVGRTMAFCVLAFSQLFHAFNVRSIQHSAFSKDVGFNKWLLGAVGVSAAMMLLVLTIPFLENVFSLVDMSLNQWCWVFALSASTVVVVELFKLLGINNIKDKQK
ncbi:cation-translocating P-type ATPase, partial [Eubacteriales bacterium OttesenSCG-928-N14]|nr:cation-translocating P-type ATPase [Eubacteriales bacterium OttesenSCG-928-N14]